MSLTTNQLLELNGIKTCIINNYLKGRVERDFALLISKGYIEIKKNTSTSHILIVYTDEMPVANRRQVFNHSLLKNRFHLK